MIKKVAAILILVLVMGLGFLVRKKYYAQIPLSGQSTDEYSYSWVGLSLIKVGMPVGISGFPGYKNGEKRYINVDNYMKVIPSDPLEINYPWMDHPPLLGLITGGYAYLSGARSFSDTSSLTIRRPMVVIGTLSVGLLMIFCLINFGMATSIIAGLVYATAPLVVLSSRMIQAENVIIPGLLLTMIGLSLFFRTKKDKWLILAAMAAGITTLFKLTGVVCHLLVILSLLAYYRGLSRQFWKDVVFFLAISLPITLLFVFYGLVYGAENFKTIFFSNYNRFYGIGPAAIFDLIRNQRLTQHKFLPELWVIGGWIAFLMGISKRSSNMGEKILNVGVISYLIVYLFFGSQPYGWYTFPFWPLLIGCWTRFVVSNLYKRKYLVVILMLSVAMLGANVSRLINIDEFQRYSGWWRFGVSGILIGGLIAAITRLNLRTVKMVALCLFVLAMVYLNLRYLNMINIEYWWNNIS